MQTKQAASSRIPAENLPVKGIGISHIPAEGVGKPLLHKSEASLAGQNVLQVENRTANFPDSFYYITMCDKCQCFFSIFSLILDKMIVIRGGGVRPMSEIFSKIEIISLQISHTATRAPMIKPASRSRPRAEVA